MYNEKKKNGGIMVYYYIAQKLKNIPNSSRQLPASNPVAKITKNYFDQTVTRILKKYMKWFLLLISDII